MKLLSGQLNKQFFVSNKLLIIVSASIFSYFKENLVYIFASTGIKKCNLEKGTDDVAIFLISFILLHGKRKADVKVYM